MITSQGDNPRMMFTIQGNGREFLACSRVVTQWRESFPLKEGLMAILNLPDSVLVVVRSIDMLDNFNFRNSRVVTYVTGMSPQSTILRPERKGLTSRGTLYPPYRVRRREPARIPAGPKRAPGR
jgi:hypothetical protein